MHYNRVVGFMYFNIVQKGDKASPSIILAVRALLVKMLITIEPCLHLVQILNTFFFLFLFFSIFCLFSFYFFLHCFFFFFFFFLFLFFSFFFLYLCILTLSSHWYEKGETSPSIILAGQALLVNMLITLEPFCIFGSNFVYLCILTLPSLW